MALSQTMEKRRGRPPNSLSRFTDEDLDRAQALRDDGIANSEVASRFGVTPNTMARLLSDHRLGLRKGSLKRLKRVLSETLRRVLLGYSHREIARSRNESEATVTQRLGRAGYDAEDRKKMRKRAQGRRTKPK